MADWICKHGHVNPKKYKGQCSLCKKDRDKTYRLTHVEEEIQRRAKRRDIHRDRAFKLLGNCCKDCGNSDRRVLQFDHLRDKKFNVSKYLSSGWPNLEQELAKCELVCANCHCIRTYERRYKVERKYDV